MDPMPAFSQNNQAAGKDKANPPPANLPTKKVGAPENIGAGGFDIKVPPQGALNSSKSPVNFNSAAKPDKNIKVNLDLNSAPPASFEKNTASNNLVPKPSFSSGQSVQNNSLPQNGENKKFDPYKLSSGELQGPKSPLVPNKNHALIFILVAGLVIGALAIGGYYLMNKNNNNIPVAVISPTPEPTVNLNLDTDSDGIPDVVEKAIGTNLSKMDTDNDSFNDLPEIKNGYSPIIAGASGKYTPEQWQAVKDKIKAVDSKFYENVFGNFSPTSTPVSILTPSPDISK